MTNWIASDKSIIPIEMYSELNYVISRFNLKAFAIGLRMEGAENLYHNIAELITPLEQGIFFFKCVKKIRDIVPNHLSISLKTDLCQDINGGFAFSR